MHIDQASGEHVSWRVVGTALLVVFLAGLSPAGAQALPELGASLRRYAAISHTARLESVRVQSDSDSVQVTLDLEAAVQYKSGWLAPALLYFDLLNTEISPRLRDREISVNQRYLKRIWIAQERVGLTRVVFDLDAATRHTSSVLENPPRLVLELKGRDEIPRTAEEPSKALKVKELAPGKDDRGGGPAAAVPAAQVGPSFPPGRSPQGASITGPRAMIGIPRVSRAPKLEDFLHGTPREAETRVTGFRQREPGDGTPTSEETSAYLSYDDKNLYVVFLCKDEPGKVRAHLAKRDDISSDDQVAVYLDTFSDHRRAYMFATNPLGVQSDGVFTEGESNPDLTFDTLWYSEGRLTEDGYIVWMAIPFKSLRFSSSDLQSWGLALGRTIYRRNEETFWPYITNRIEGFTQQMATLGGLKRISPGRNVQLIPYGLFARARALDTVDPNNPRLRTDSEVRAGLDAKVVVRDALTFDVALNPDFSQVESNQPQVTINERFEVFFPEKRPFFIENADFFRTPVNLFFSRRIADPQFGVRVTGKVGRWALAALGMDDRGPGNGRLASDLLRGDRAGVGVLSVHREFGGQNIIGVLMTSRDFASSSNRVFSIDTRLKLSPNWVFSGQAIQSYTRDLNGQRRSGPAFLADITHTGRHLTYSASYEDRSPNFDANPLGFIQRVDIRQMEHFVNYLWRPEGRRVLNLGPSLTTLVNWNHQGRMQDWFASSGFAVFFASATQVRFSRTETYELFDNVGFRKGDTGVSFSTEPRQWLGISLSYSKGTNVNFSPAAGLSPFLGNSRTSNFELTLRPTPRLRFDQTYIYSRLGTRQGFTPPGVPASASIFNNHLFRWKVNYQFTRALSLRAILDYNAVLANPSLIAQERTKSLTGDILLTYLLNPGTALYIGYTDRHENLALDPTLPPSLRLHRIRGPNTSTGRQFFVKLSYLFRF
jgi:hypothetical protein